jgi:hypothetical protein
MTLPNLTVLGAKGRLLNSRLVYLLSVTKIEDTRLNLDSQGRICDTPSVNKIREL